MDGWGRKGVNPGSNAGPTDRLDKIDNRCICIASLQSKTRVKRLFFQD